MGCIEENLSQALSRERKAKLIVAELNNFTELKPTLLTVMRHIKEITGCQAVGIRLQDGMDYPYYIYRGFPESFVKKESRLCARDENGDPLHSPDGKGYLLECMCGNVIRGRFDPAMPFFSIGGSFWSNHTSKLLKTSTEEDRQCHTRNYCNSCGYESVALVPIKCREEIIGLLQLNDLRQDRFSPELIEYLEMICTHVGLAIHNSRIFSKLKEALEEIQALRGLIPICASCKRIRNDKGYWESVEEYISRHSEAEFTHDICPDCAKRLYPDLQLNHPFM